ncbi:hypothetical protein HDU88_007883 [Geranomyces variabilis]|nr:hypothetical protein HDU88_007883 [Geranomyces variabilis]
MHFRNVALATVFCILATASATVFTMDVFHSDDGCRESIATLYGNTGDCFSTYFQGGTLVVTCTDSEAHVTRYPDPEACARGLPQDIIPSENSIAPLNTCSNDRIYRCYENATRIAPPAHPELWNGTVTQRVYWNSSTCDPTAFLWEFNNEVIGCETMGQNSSVYQTCGGNRTVSYLYENSNCSADGFGGVLLYEKWDACSLDSVNAASSTVECRRSGAEPVLPVLEGNYTIPPLVTGRALGAACTVDSQCASTNCMGSVCEPHGQHALGALCVDSSGCVSATCVNALCVLPGQKALGTACNVAADCASENCLNAVCALMGKKPGLGAACTSSDMCESGMCSNGVCRYAGGTGSGSPPRLVAETSSNEIGLAPNTKVAISLPGSLFLSMTASSSAYLNVTVSPSPPASVTAPAKGISTYYDFLTSANSFSAALTFAYVDEFLAALNYSAKDLTWARFDSGSGTWQTQGATVDVVQKTVVYTTSGFSTWTIVSVEAGETSAAVGTIGSSRAALAMALLSALVVMMI